jgi:hypothetical protein
MIEQGALDIVKSTKTRDGMITFKGELYGNECHGFFPNVYNNAYMYETGFNQYDLFAINKIANLANAPKSILRLL